MRRRRWNSTRFAGWIALCTTSLLTIRNLLFPGWVKRYFGIPLPMVLFGEAVGVLSIGIVVDLLAPRVKNRFHAVLAGMVAGFIALLIQVSLLDWGSQDRVGLRGVLYTSAFGAVTIGGTFGAIFWDPDPDD